jgi:hypothetical protein
MSLSVRISSLFQITMMAAAMVACGASTGNGASDSADDPLTEEAAKTGMLHFGGQSPKVEASTTTPVEYHFSVATDGAAADVSVFATTTDAYPTYTDTVPPVSLAILSPSGEALSGEASDWNPAGASTAITAYRRLKIENLPVGTYTIRYVPVAGEAYVVELQGQDGKAVGSRCTLGASGHMRNNPGCANGLICFEASSSGFCGYATQAGAGCSTADSRNKHAAEDDECGAGYFCKYSRGATHGDEGWNGYCTRDTR